MMYEDNISVGEATAGIRVAAAESWRHDERANSSRRKTRREIVQQHRPAELKLER